MVMKQAIDKKRRGGRGTGKAKRTRSAGRTNTHPSNGSLPESQAVAPTPAPEPVPVGEAMRLAVEALGPPAVDNALAAQQLADIGASFEDLTRRQAAYAVKLDEAKVAKKSVDAAQELVNEKVRMYTHPPQDLPLLDLASREADHESMLDAVEQGGADVEVFVEPEPNDEALAGSAV